MTTATRSAVLAGRPRLRAGYPALAEAVIVRAAQDLPKHDLYRWVRTQPAELWFGLAGYARGRWLRLSEPAYREWAEADRAERSRKSTGLREARRERRRMRREKVSAKQERNRTLQLRYRLQSYYREHGTLRGIWLQDKTRDRLQRLGGLWLRRVLREAAGSR